MADKQAPITIGPKFPAVLTGQMGCLMSGWPVRAYMQLPNETVRSTVCELVVTLHSHVHGAKEVKV